MEGKCVSFLQHLPEQGTLQLRVQGLISISFAAALHFTGIHLSMDKFFFYFRGRVIASRVYLPESSLWEFLKKIPRHARGFTLTPHAKSDTC
jgi:hypothetical protein